jgi:hypothetical protein
MLTISLLVACLCLFIFSQVDSNTTGNNDLLYTTLVSAQARLNETTPGCPNYGFAPAAIDYIRGKWNAYLDGVDALVYLSCINTIYFGNHIGTYLNEVSSYIVNK